MKSNIHTKHLLVRIMLTGLISQFFISFAVAAPLIAKPSVASVGALKGDAKKGKDAFHTCALCHTPEGWGSEEGNYPQLSGQHPNVLIKQLIDIKSGNRAVPTMIPFSDEIFDKGHQHVADVVSYIATLPMIPKNSVGQGDDLDKGKKLYTSQCESCHGKHAEGNNEKGYPLLQGQHYEYLFRQTLWIKDGLRKNGDKKMEKRIAAFSDADIRAVSDYISRIKPDKNKLADSADWQNPDFHGDFVSVPANVTKKSNSQ
ncbi:c-type cytochrome [Cocleimonas flava]|uniref:Cytochrome c553 n=1 Tax=Cocleimonas flava TaxID=634765 RepID=A0A4R1F2B1_9GAMM|nr:c-type cytochrome [Cocleimonas flava]TCJ88277.1 cytochrome c553 [Cocleimonas flava]